MFLASSSTWFSSQPSQLASDVSDLSSISEVHTLHVASIAFVGGMTAVPYQLANCRAGEKLIDPPSPDEPEPHLALARHAMAVGIPMAVARWRTGRSGDREAGDEEATLVRTC